MCFRVSRTNIQDIENCAKNRFFCHCVAGSGAFYSLDEFGYSMYVAAENGFRSGQVSIGEGYVKWLGSTGYGWSSQANESNIGAAYILDFNSFSVIPSYNYTRWFAFPLRCLARQ